MVAVTRDSATIVHDLIVATLAAFGVTAILFAAAAAFQGNASAAVQWRLFAVVFETAGRIIDPPSDASNRGNLE